MWSYWHVRDRRTDRQTVGQTDWNPSRGRYFYLFIYYYARRQPDIVIQHDTPIQKFKNIKQTILIWYNLCKLYCNPSMDLLWYICRIFYRASQTWSSREISDGNRVASRTWVIAVPTWPITCWTYRCKRRRRRTTCRLEVMPLDREDELQAAAVAALFDTYRFSSAPRRLRRFLPVLLPRYASSIILHYIRVCGYSSVGHNAQASVRQSGERESIPDVLPIWIFRPRHLTGWWRSNDR